MASPIDLKNEKYLADYEKQIRSLPLGELYEVLDIVKKDSTPERVKIVNTRIHELENTPKPEKPKKEKATKVTPEKTAAVATSKKELPREHHHHGHHGHHHEHSPKASVLTWVVIYLSLAALCGSRALDYFCGGSSIPDDLTERILNCSIEITPFIAFGIGYLIFRGIHRTKKRAMLLGITTFLMAKSALGYFFETYMGFMSKFYDERAITISTVVFPVALAFTIIMCLRKTTKPRDAEGLVPLAIALLAETAVYMQLV